MRLRVAQIYLLSWTIVSSGIVLSATPALAKAPEGQSQASQADERTKEIGNLKTELLVAKTEQQAMKQLEKLLGKYRGTPMEAGLLLRKAELFGRMSKTDRFFEISRDSETIVSLAPQLAKNASSKKYLSLSVETYDQIQRRFPNFEDLDIVLFNNAFTRQQLNQEKPAENLYRELARRFPNSVLIPDTHLALGEMLFEKKDFQGALGEFEKIKAYPDARVYPYGLYKTAWTKYNLKDAHGGLKELESVVDLGKRIEAEGLDRKLDLRVEALQDMVLFFGEVGDPSRAFDYFGKQAGEGKSGSFLLKLSHLYVRHGKHSEHQKVLRDLISRSPAAEEVPLAYEGLVEDFETQRDRERAVATLVEMDGVCQATSRWTKSQAPDTKDLCKKTILKLTQNFASKWNRMWKKNPTYPHFADSAEQAYRIFLGQSESGQTALEMRFAFSELLFERKKYREASDQYFLVGSEVKTGPLVHDATYASIVALERSVADKWSDPDEKRFQEISALYLKRNPQGQYHTDIQFKRAFIAYEKGRYNEAAPQFKSLGWDKRDTKFGEKAQTLYLDILNIKKDYAELREFSQKLLATKLSPQRGQEIQKIFEEASFAEAQQLEEREQWLAAATGFENFSKKSPTSPLADKATWNAIRLYSRIGETETVARLSSELVKAHPKSAHVKEALLLAAQGYESLLRLEESAQALQQLAERDPEQGPKWLALAADFLALSGTREAAIKIYRKLTQSKVAAVSAAAYAKLLILTASDRTALEKLKTEIAGSGIQPQASLAQAQITEDLFNAKKYSEAFRSASRVLEMRKSASPAALGRARLVQAHVLGLEFYEQSVKSRGERFALVLQIKTEKLEKAQSAFQDVVRFGDPRTSLLALKGLARAYGHYVEAVRGVELIGSYTPQEVSALKKELETITLPIEDKHVDTLTEALKLAKKLEYRDGSVAELQMDLNRLNLKRAPSQQIVLRLPGVWLPRFSSGALMGAL